MLTGVRAAAPPYVLSHLPDEFARLTPDDQKRMAHQVIKQIRLHSISPHLFLLHVEWQNGIAACADLALIWRGMGPKSAENGHEEKTSGCDSCTQAGPR